MEIFTSVSSLRSALYACRRGGKSVGLVPTMGALHKGHLSLVEQCLGTSDISVVSVYVNPTQFNNKDDLKNYPRDLKKDALLLEESGCHFIFAPDDREMYPVEDSRKFEFGRMGNIMEGKFRPGHFDGVAKIVTKLFDIVEPQNAYFGKKDFQQLAIIKKLVRDNKYSIQIIECPIIREADGLAMSSRNQLLTPEHRKAAPLIYHTLHKAAQMVPEKDLDTLRNFVINTIHSEPLLQLEYFEIVDSDTLHKTDALVPGRKATACIAVFAGKIRLIDNIDFIL